MGIRVIDARDADQMSWAAKWDLLAPHLIQHGCHCLAHSSTQRGMSYFMDDATGYLAYMPVANRRFVLADPIARAGGHELAAEFEDLCSRDRKKVVYCQLSREAAMAACGRGFYANSIGVENLVDLHDFKISWNSRRDLKRWLSALAKDGIVVSEQRVSSLDLQALKRLSEEWLSMKVSKQELCFMARPFVLDDEPNVRKYFAWRDGELLAICTFDPCYADGTVVSYALNHIRFGKSAPNGIVDYTILKAIETIRQDGFRVVNIGLSPMHSRETGDPEMRASAWTDRLFAFIYDYLGRAYHFKSLGFHKDRYQARKEQVYVATQTYFTLPDIVLLLRVNRVI